MNNPSLTDTDRRTAILDAAVESFGKLGYYGTSLQRIATEVGLTKAGVLQAGFSMMDGLQLRWLRSPGQDLNTMWADCEDALMPLPLWEGYR